MSSKIKDGLFMGDVDAAQDAEFLQLNGIVHIVNCVPRQVPNLFQQSLGLSYTACDLDDVLRRPLFDLKNREFMTFVQLVDRALEKTESVLVHSLHGVNRSPSLLIGYLMVKYCWGVDKAYDFVATKRSDIKLDESYAEQLCALETQLQKTYPTRATEQQLYEWHASSVDPKTDELVLVHTYLNATAKPSAASSADHIRKRSAARAQRRLSWIDQCAHLKKLHPSLMAKPERPPNHSYSEMFPNNGWVDVVNPSNRPPAVSASERDQSIFQPPKALPPTSRDRSASLGTISDASPSSGDSLHALSILTTQQENASPDFEIESTQLSRAGGGARLHSFSQPKKKECEPEAPIPPQSPASSSDRDELEVTYEYPGSSRFPKPRYLQETLASINARPRKPSSRPSVRRTPSYSAPGTKTSLPTSTAMSHIFTKTLAAANISAAADIKASKGKRAVDCMAPAHKALASRAPRASSTISSTNASVSTGRVLFSADFPHPTTGALGAAPSGAAPQALGGSTMRRGYPESGDPASLAGLTRPRTAPPRMRKKEIETSDLLYSKRMDTGVRAQMPSESTQTARRPRSSLDYGPTASGSSSSSASTAAGAQSKASSRRSTVGAAPLVSASFSRAKATRAQWK